MHITFGNNNTLMMAIKSNGYTLTTLAKRLKTTRQRLSKMVNNPERYPINQLQDIFAILKVKPVLLLLPE